MKNPQVTQPAAAKTAMLIRRPVETVFEAFVNLEITTRFWFTKSSGPLESGKAGALGFPVARAWCWWKSTSCPEPGC